MPVIKSQKDWWRAVNDNWLELCEILARFLPMTKYEDIHSNMLFHPLYLEVEKAWINRDWEELHLYLEAAWGAAPDDISIHSIPGWDVLCDLCSEIWVFEERSE